MNFLSFIFVMYSVCFNRFQLSFDVRIILIGQHHLHVCTVCAHTPGHLWLTLRWLCSSQALVTGQMDSLLATAGPEWPPYRRLRPLCFLGQVHLSHDDGETKRGHLQLGVAPNASYSYCSFPTGQLKSYAWFREVTQDLSKIWGQFFSLTQSFFPLF